MPIDMSYLQTKLESIRDSAVATKHDVQRFTALLRALPDESLFRVNPLSFALQHGLASDVVVELFIRSVHLGLFDIHWRMVCIYCGAVEYVYDSIDKIPHTSFHCTPCNTDIASLLDERVEVTFTPSSAIGSLEVNPFRNAASYRLHFTSPSIVPAPEFAEYLLKAELGIGVLEIGASADFQVVLEKGESARVVSYDRHAVAFVRTDERAEELTRVEFWVTPSGISPGEVRVRRGVCSIRVSNALAEPMGFMLLDGDVEHFEHLVTTHRSTRKPYFTAQMLLNHQTFRTLFRVLHTDPNLALNIHNQSILFTDLESSTQLYDRIGDVEAYQSVRRHFRELTDATAKHSGAIVKTIGDGVMATFSTARDAVMAAIEMQHRIAELNKVALSPGVTLGLRIGIHTGMVLTVNAEDRLDYFGQTVNIAARVQGLAHAGQICVTRSVLYSPGVAELLGPDAEDTDEPISLRGIGLPMHVRRIVVR